MADQATRDLDYDAIAELVPFKVDGVTRFRRRLDLDGRKYSIILPENIPPEGDDTAPLYLVAHFLRHGEEWLAADSAYRYANIVTHLAEAVWERVYVAPVAEDEPPAPTPAGVTAWTFESAFEPTGEMQLRMRRWSASYARRIPLAQGDDDKPTRESARRRADRRRRAHEAGGRSRGIRRDRTQGDD